MPRRANHSRDDLRILAALSDIGGALGGSADLRSALERMLEKLEAGRGIARGAVFLLHEDTGEIHVEAGVGIPSNGLRARYRPGEGIVGRVVQSGRPVIVPATGREPLLLDRAFQRRASGAPEASFVAVPIAPDRRATGALAVDFPVAGKHDLQVEAHFLSVVAAMVAQALRAQRAIEDERTRLLAENVNLRSELEERYDLSNIVGTSGPMRQVYEQIAQVAQTSTTVLIRGESGTGKELIAHAIHYNSPRAKQPFVKVSCAALPDTLIESELFGYERGAFTGAQARKRGRFELAHGGTLFLDEVGELNLPTQVKLLRVLQEGEFERLGGTETLKADVRLIAATNRDLEAAMAERQFREDLYYRLNVFSLFVPPLRDRKPDVMLLADHFLIKYARQHNKRIRRIATPAIDMLMAYHWPGNVRELENTIERAVLTCDGQVIHGHHLSPTLQTAESSGTTVQVSLTDAVGQYEKDLLLDVLKSARGNCARAARLLGTTERIVSYKVRKYGIEVERFRGKGAPAAPRGRSAARAALSAPARR
ncbi:MAG TPA: sigma 54-interacting transcriptional regulator [Myxococcaceae bacterium]|nr:sigma 54-interacting transcriptional regulator [Myxococcaceae bacterium]